MNDPFNFLNDPFNFPPAVDLPRIIRSFGPVARQFVDAHDRLEQIVAREVELTAELEVLCKQREEICNILENKEVQGILHRLLQIRENSGPTK